MSLQVSYKTLVHAQSVAQQLFNQLPTLRNRSSIAEAVGKAVDAINADLKSATAKSIESVSDLSDARLQIKGISSSLTEMAKSIVNKRMDFARYKQFIKEQSDLLPSIELHLGNANNILKQVSAVTNSEETSAAVDALSIPEFIKLCTNYLRNKKGTDPSTDVGTLNRLISGFTSGEIERFVRTQKLPEELQMLLGSVSQRLLRTLLGQANLNNSQRNQNRRDTEDMAYTAQTIQKVRALAAKYKPKISALKVAQHGVNMIDLPIVTTLTAPLRDDTFKKVGIDASTFSYQRFANNTYLLQNQHVLVMRLSDALEYNKETTNADRRSDGNIKQLNNLNKALRTRKAELEKMEGMAVPAKAGTALTHNTTLRKLREEVDSLEKQVAAVTASAEAAKKIIRNKAKARKVDNNTAVFDYANHLLDLINERSSVQQSMVTGRVLAKIGDPDFVMVWIMPTSARRHLASAAGVGDFVKVWQLPWG